MLHQGDENRMVTQYHYTAWPDHGVPKFATPLLSFIRRINREYPKNRGSMVVHCRYRARCEFMEKLMLLMKNGFLALVLVELEHLLLLTPCLRELKRVSPLISTAVLHL